MNTPAVARPVALLEREHEVERIRAVLHSAGRRDGGALLIEAAPGMGKSRLLDEARCCAEHIGLRLLQARATQMESGFPFGIVRQLFELPLRDAAQAERDRWLEGAASLAADLLTGAPIGSTGSAPGVDPEYAWHHGLYWLASNLAADTPAVLLIDDLHWCDGPSARALSFIARRLEGQPLAIVLATRPLDPAVTPEAAALASDPSTQTLRPAPLTQAAVGALVAARLGGRPDEAFVLACADVTGGNPFLIGELLDEVAARGLAPTSADAAQVATLVPRGVANSVLLRLSRLPPTAGALARALSVLGDGASVRDAARLARVDGAELESASAALVFAGVVEAGGSMRFVHPILGTAIYGDLSPAERERLHYAAATILRERGAPAGQIAAQVMHTEPTGNPAAVELLREAARDAFALGDAAGASRLLLRAIDEPPAEVDRSAVMLELGRAQARAGAPDAIALLSEIVEHADDSAAAATAAIELANMLLFAGRAAEGAAILRRARDHVGDEDRVRERLEVALMGISCSSVAAKREADESMVGFCSSQRRADGQLPATTLVTLALDEIMRPGSAARAGDLAERALAAGLPTEPHRAWALLALAVLTVADRFDTALLHANEVLAEAQQRGAALTVSSVLAHRAFIEVRRGDLTAAEVHAHAAIELASDLAGSEFVLALAVPSAVLAGLDRGETPESLRRLFDRAGVRLDTELIAGSELRYASGVLRAAAGNHESAVEELRDWGLANATFGGGNPAVSPWRSTAALSLAKLGRHKDACDLADDELSRARAFGASRAIGIALRTCALVGRSDDREALLKAACDVLDRSPARLENGRALIDLGATLRAAGQRKAAREPLLEGLELAGRCGARRLESRARAELGAIGVRPRSTDRSGTDSLTPSERRVVDLAAAGGTNREIAQTLFVTEKTVETHLGRAFRKLDISSRRQLPDALAHAGSDHLKMP
ncbi:MAG TPA: AAA family ATPase [Thermoleophilaceae bacterium]